MEEDINAKIMDELSITKAKKYLEENHVVLSTDIQQQNILEEVFINAFSKGYLRGVNDMSDVLDSILGSICKHKC